MKLKCIKSCKYFTEGAYYPVMKYEYDSFYIVTDDEKKEHYISIQFAIDHFMETL